MTIQKPDFNQIFASQAPDVDKPPVFKNYNGGWGVESQPNNGKPTIKQMNYLGQDISFKFLWMAQNGVFPYDPNIEYPVGVVTIKDGRFKQWNGTDWINFGQDDSALKITNNLSDVPSKATARTNLDVYSKVETDANIASAAATPNASETTAGKAKIATTAIAQAGTNDTDFITAKKLKNTVFGVSSTYQDVTSTRNLNTTYTNTTGRVIFVAVICNGGAHLTVTINDGLIYSQTLIESDGRVAHAMRGTAIFPVPSGATYKVTASSITAWWEW